MNEFHTIRVNFMGGIVSPGLLKDILSILASCEVRNVSFGLRQQMIFKLSILHETTFVQRMKSIKAHYFMNENPCPNIVSSYVAEEVFQKGNWLTEGIYKDVLDAFEHDPSLKINISDANQSFTPFFSGHLNFISSEIPNFWYLYIRKPKSNDIQAQDRLYFSNELASIATFLESRIENFQDMDIPAVITHKAEKPLVLPKFSLPYYEGFNRYGNKSWLGIYQRDEAFELNFLQEVCDLCLQTKIGEICLTPWKSLIIKNISEIHRQKWSAILAKFDINVRHAANELNWQIEDDSREALSLKKRLISYFNKKDLRTFGISLGIKTIPRTEVFASILVRQRRLPFLSFLKIYDITYTVDYDPNGRNIDFFDKGILGINLPERLRHSVIAFNKKIAGNASSEPTVFFTESPKVPSYKELYQCENCLTVYDATYGDEVNEIRAGTSFDKLPEDYKCSVCSADKSAYKKVNLQWAEV